MAIILKVCQPDNFKNQPNPPTVLLIYFFFKRFSFLDSRKVSFLLPVVKNINERAMAETYFPVSLSSIVRKIFEKLLNNRLVDCIRKFDFLSDFQYGFRYFCYFYMFLLLLQIF